VAEEGLSRGRCGGGGGFAGGGVSVRAREHMNIFFVFFGYVEVERRDVVFETEFG
jgi:hypothetical protein